ncbi:hypothetical protein AA103196_3090 [Ameyamaea chiangmaiensis NBRC 103196]|uniref:Uncharacterized protein n=1 Tax=Ameyamaea chiangmaiensis TaxID=442969 RepID=A0A850PE53_9PROT|nr:hypothetical protein [Ameyamaea chiangmaiensis]MBS4074575.1 hypothetical protein [Ameyamaea chiangmaiensis]NVN39331.1 hypothetical protein [Ameyamaea chiangmaiensis]GBQ72541.1 hypothetical protein AA103196_3090 [Ameyamaea chiangmaiensis NBRC 103196]
MTAVVRLYHPSDTFGRLICWRLESDYSHATIELGGLIYSATFPHIVAVAENDPAFGMPPRQGLALEVRLSDDEAARALAYCRSMVGSDYDVLAMLGWAFRIERMQRPGHVYCFEYVADALAAAGVFQQSKRLITGEQLLNDLYRAGRIAEPPAGTARLARAQRPAVTVRAPKVNP